MFYEEIKCVIETRKNKTKLRETRQFGRNSQYKYQNAAFLDLRFRVVTIRQS